MLRVIVVKSSSELTLFILFDGTIMQSESLSEDTMTISFFFFFTIGVGAIVTGTIGSGISTTAGKTSL